MKAIWRMPNQPILTVMNTSRLIAKAHIPQSEAAVLKVGNPAELKIPGLDEPIKGRVSLVSPGLSIPAALRLKYGSKRPSRTRR